MDKARLKTAKYVCSTVPPMKTTLGGDFMFCLERW